MPSPTAGHFTHHSPQPHAPGLPPCAPRCDIVRDYKTGDSLNYAFVEFEQIDSATQATRLQEGLTLTLTLAPSL